MSPSNATNAPDAALPIETQLSLPVRLAQYGRSSAQPATSTHQQQNNMRHSNNEHIKLTLWNLPEFHLMTHDKWG